MEDQGSELPLDRETIAQLMSSADFRYENRHIPSLLRMSEEETLYVAIFVIVVCSALYIHVDVRPFLPFEIAPKTADSIAEPPFVAVLLAAVRISGYLIWFILSLILVVYRKLNPAQPRIACHPCGARISPAE
jgi:hypothetical protein